MCHVSCVICQVSCDRWHKIGGRWQVTGDTWHVKCDTWHVYFLIFLFSWYWCYYPHRSRDSVSPVCRIFWWGSSSLCLSIFVFIILVQSYSVHYVFSWLTLGGWHTKTDRHTKEHRYVYTQPAKRLIEWKCLHPKWA